MDPLLMGALAASIILLILMIAIVSGIGRNRSRSLARVEALQALAEESSPDLLPPTPDQDESWDVEFREHVRAEVRPAAPAARIAAMALPFVVNLPDESGASRYQVSFHRKGSRP